jgi:MFS family permease
MSQAVRFILCGRLSDIFGRRCIFIAGDVLGVVSCIISATNTTVAQLCVGSVMMCFGEAVMNSFVVALVELVKNKHRPYIISSIYLFAAPFTTFSPLIGRSFACRGARIFRPVWIFTDRVHSNSDDLAWHELAMDFLGVHDQLWRRPDSHHSLLSPTPLRPAALIRTTHHLDVASRS